MLYRCDGSQFQDWVWDSAEQTVMNAATGMCLGVGGDGDSRSSIGSGTALALYACSGGATSYDGVARWTKSFFEETRVNASHGMFHYDGPDSAALGAPTVGLTWNKTTWDMPFSEVTSGLSLVDESRRGAYIRMSSVCRFG